MKLKTLTIKELRAKKSSEIEKYISELKKSQTELNHAIYTNKEKQTHQVSLIRKAIARAQTILASQAQAGEEK